MKARELGSIVLKILGIYWFVLAMEYLLRGALLPFMGLDDKLGGYNAEIEIISVLLFAALFATSSFFCMFRTDFLLRVLGIGVKGTGRSTPSKSATDYKTLAFTLLGLYFVVAAFGKIMVDIIKLWLPWTRTNSDYSMFTQSAFFTLWPDLMENIVTLCRCHEARDTMRGFDVRTV